MRETTAPPRVSLLIRRLHAAGRAGGGLNLVLSEACRGKIVINRILAPDARAIAKHNWKMPTPRRPIPTTLTTFG